MQGKDGTTDFNIIQRSHTLENITTAINVIIAYLIEPNN